MRQLDMRLVAASPEPDPDTGLYDVTFESVEAGSLRHDLAVFLAVLTPATADTPPIRNLCGWEVRRSSHGLIVFLIIAAMQIASNANRRRPCGCISLPVNQQSDIFAPLCSAADEQRCACFKWAAKRSVHILGQPARPCALCCLLHVASGRHAREVCKPTFLVCGNCRALSCVSNQNLHANSLWNRS